MRDGMFGERNRVGSRSQCGKGMRCDVMDLENICFQLGAFKPCVVPAAMMTTTMMMAPVIVNGFKGTAARSWDFGSERAEFVKKVAWARRVSNSMHVPGKKQAYFNFKD